MKSIWGPWVDKGKVPMTWNKVWANKEGWSMYQCWCDAPWVNEMTIVHVMDSKHDTNWNIIESAYANSLLYLKFWGRITQRQNQQIHSLWLLSHYINGNEYVLLDFFMYYRKPNKVLELKDHDFVPKSMPAIKWFTVKWDIHVENGMMDQLYGKTTLTLSHISSSDGRVCQRAWTCLKLVVQICPQEDWH